VRTQGRIPAVQVRSRPRKSAENRHSRGREQPRIALPRECSTTELRQRPFVAASARESGRHHISHWPANGKLPTVTQQRWWRPGGREGQRRPRSGGAQRCRKKVVCDSERAVSRETSLLKALTPPSLVCS
jgi:hypothetical protein